MYVCDDNHEAFERGDKRTGDEWRFIGVSTEEPVKSTEPPKASKEAPEAQAGVPGTAVLGTATLDSLVTLAFATKSADLAGAISYVWSTPSQIVGTFPAGTTPSAVNGAMVKISFEPRAAAPSVLKP